MSFAGDESVEVRHLRAATEALRQRLSGYERDGAPDGVRHLVGLQRLVEQLVEMEPRAQRSVWILQPRYFWDPEDPGVELTYGTQARGVTTLLVTRPATLQVHPLLPSIFPTTRVAPVFIGAMVVDEHEAVIAGEDSGLGERTIWVTEREDIVAAVLHIWNLTLELSVPILPPGTQPPLSRRQLRVAQLLAVGEKDNAIARRLDMSVRSVERDVHAILTELGARSRTEAVLLMRGRGVNGGQPDSL
jgi:DNA-binding CsgD family transcriptional regulator